MEGTSNKRSRSQKHYSNTFKTKKVKKLYANRFKQTTVLAERGVTCADFTDKRGLGGSEYSARRPCLKGHPISTEISYLMPSDSAPCCSSSSSHSPTRTNPHRQTLLSRPRTRSSKVKKSLGPSASRDISSHSAKTKVGDGDISTRLSSNIPIAKARKDLSDHMAKARKRKGEVKDLALSSTCTSAHPFVQCMNLINELIKAHEISKATYIEAIRVFRSRQLQWDFIRMSGDNRKSWLSQLLA